MAASEIPDPAPASGDPDAVPETNPPSEPPLADPRREWVRQRVQCAKIRHWCRDLLADPRSGGVLPAATVRDLEDTPPGLTLDEVYPALRALSQDEPLPPTPVPPNDGSTLRREIATLTAERERLRTVLFTLYDALFPDDLPPTEEELRRQMQEPCGQSISEIIDQLERELAATDRE